MPFIRSLFPQKLCYRCLIRSQDVSALILYPYSLVSLSEVTCSLIVVCFFKNNRFPTVFPIIFLCVEKTLLFICHKKIITYIRL